MRRADRWRGLPLLAGQTAAGADPSGDGDGDSPRARRSSGPPRRRVRESAGRGLGSRLLVGTGGRGPRGARRRADPSLPFPAPFCVSPQTAPAPGARSLSSGPREGGGGGSRVERPEGEPAGPAGNMATGGYRPGGGGSTTDFLEEWKAKREKLRAKQNPPGPAAPGAGGSDAAAKPQPGASGTSAAAAANELNNNVAGGAAAPAAPGGVNCAVGPAALTRAAPGPRRLEDEPLAGAAAAAASGAPPARGDEGERDGAPEKSKSSGPSARKGKGQIEKRKLREKRRSTGVVNIPAAEVSRARAAAGPGVGLEGGCRLLVPFSRELPVSWAEFAHSGSYCRRLALS